MEEKCKTGQLGQTAELKELCLKLVSEIVRGKKSMGISPDYAIGRELHAIVDASLEHLVKEGKLRERRASVNCYQAYELP